MPLDTPRARDDIEIGEIDDCTFEVRDPIRSTIFHFGPAQKSIYDGLNGSLTPEEVANLVSEEFEVEIPTSDVEEFVEFLRTHFLLDVSEYDLNDTKFSSKLIRTLTKSGVLRRAWSFAGEMEGANEGDLSCALAALEGGDLNEAVKLLTSENEISGAILDQIRKAFFTSQNDGEDIRQWPFGNPDRLLTVVDNAIGRWLYGPIGVLVLSLLFALAAYGASGATLPSPEQFSWFDGLAGYALKYVFTLCGHELMGHGLAAKHYGGTVSEVGAMLRNRSSVILYCDVSGALFAGQTRKAKVVIFLGGVLADLVVASLITIVFTLVFDLAQAPRPLLVALFFVIFSSIENSLPLRGHDGCWVLAALLKLPDLWLGEKAQRYWSKRLGFADEQERKDDSWSPREERIYNVFGVAEVLVLLLFFFGVWLFVVVPFVVKYLGVVGVIIAAFPTLGFLRVRIWPLARGASSLLRHRT